MHNMERHLQRGLRSVSAPPDLWDRVQAGRVSSSNVSRSNNDTNRWLVWAMAATVTLTAVGFSLIHRGTVAAQNASQQMAFRCQNPAELRAWVRANTGLDLPLRASPPASVQLIGARSIVNGENIEIAYRAGNADGRLLIARADGVPDERHGDSSGKVASWVKNGRRFTLASDNAADLQLACKLCHLD